MTATPRINMGTERGRTITALNIAVFPMVSAPPKAPNKLSRRVPIKRLINKGNSRPSGRYRKKVLIKDANKRGAPVTNQWAKTFANTNIKVGSPLIRNWSKVPSR